MRTPHKINIYKKFALFSDFWHPRIIGRLNGQMVKIARLKGEFVWHKHDKEDELFMVISGELILVFETHQEILSPGEFCIVPAGVMHKPIAINEVQVLLFEPESTINTGEIIEPRTKFHLDDLSGKD